MDKKTVWILSFLIIIIIVIISFLKFSTQEDIWLCENNSYIRHGNPESIIPDILCNKANFSYSWVITNIWDNSIEIKSMKWEFLTLKLTPESIITWINWERIIDKLKKWYAVNVNGKNIDNDTIIDKLSITKEPNIIIYSPTNNSQIDNTFEIKWEARAYENTINYRIIDSNWKIIKEGFWNVNSKSIWKFWDFDIKINLWKSLTKTWIIEIFEISEKDWSESDNVIVPIKFESKKDPSI